MDDDISTVFRDAVMLALLGFVAIVILLIAFLGKQVEDDGDKQKDGVYVEMFYGDGLNADVDLWVSHDLAEHPVGYSAKNTSVMDLLRDDLGHDISGQNFENVITRGVPEGEFVVNVHWFGNIGNYTEMHVWVVVTVRVNNTKKFEHREDVTLKYTGHEITVIRFTVHKNGTVSNINYVPKTLRSRGDDAP